MQTLRRRALIVALRIADVGVALTGLVAALVLHGRLNRLFASRDLLAAQVKLADLLLVVAFGIVWHFVFRSRGLYRSHRIGRMRSEWWEIAKGVSLGSLFVFAGAAALEVDVIDREVIGLFFAIVLPSTMLMRSGLRWALHGTRRKGRNLRNAVVVGSGPRGADLGAMMQERPELGYLLLGYIDDIPPPVHSLHGQPERLLGSLSQLEELLVSLDVDEVFVGLPVKSHYETIARVISTSEKLGIVVRMPANTFKLRLAQASVDSFEGVSFLTFDKPGPTRFDLLLKRAFDLTSSALALLALLPLFALVAPLIKLESKGPVFFVQQRVGKGRRLFWMYKFRTMAVDAEKHLPTLEARNEVEGAAFKMENDPRMTRVGSVLRKYSLDELPQLLNILLGDMSLVGPRPLPVRDVELFDPRWNGRFSVLPGLTGLWQADGRHDISFDHWMELDLRYINGWSHQLDFEILLRTLPAVLRGTGAS